MDADNNRKADTAAVTATALPLPLLCPEFENPNQMIRGKERRSKLLRADSKLHSFFTELRDRLDNRNLYPDLPSRAVDRPLHIELVRPDESFVDERVIILRAQEVQRMSLCVNSPQNYGLMTVDTNVALVFNIYPLVDKSSVFSSLSIAANLPNPMHITIHFYAGTSPAVRNNILHALDTELAEPLDSWQFIKKLKQ